MDFNITSAWKLLSEELSAWVEIAIKGIPNLVLAVVVLMLFVALAKVAKSIVARVAPQIMESEAAANLLQSLANVGVISIGLFMALGILELDKTLTSLLAGAGVIGLALGFAFQEIASNFVSGLLIAFRNPYRLGDIIEIDDYFGEVTKITLRTTSITTFQGLEVIIPNKNMFTKVFTNFTSTPKRRLDIPVGVAYTDDLRKVESVVKEALSDIDGRVKDRDIEVFFKEFGDSSINFDARVWIEYPGNKNYIKARHDAIIAIKEAFDREEISIPFPIRTLDFGTESSELKLSKPVRELLAN